MEFLKEKDIATSKEIQEACGLSRSSVDYSLNQLVKDRRVISSEDGSVSRAKRYRIREDGAGPMGAAKL